MSETMPEAPPGLKERGAALWTSVVEDFDLYRAELDVLERACKSADYIAELEAIVERDGLGIEDKIHPALVEIRLQSQVFARLIALLRLPDDQGIRPQRRGGFRGPYREARALSIAAQRARLEVVK